MHIIGHITLGPAWQPGVPVTHQGEPMRQHLRYMKTLHDRGSLILGGPYAARHGGLAIFVVDSIDEAEALAAADPANEADVISYQLEELHPVFDAATDLCRYDTMAKVMAQATERPSATATSS